MRDERYVTAHLWLMRNLLGQPLIPCMLGGHAACYLSQITTVCLSLLMHGMLNKPLMPSMLGGASFLLVNNSCQVKVPYCSYLAGAGSAWSAPPVTHVRRLSSHARQTLVPCPSWCYHPWTTTSTCRPLRAGAITTLPPRPSSHGIGLSALVGITDV
jgi:hypothetical protein